MRKVSIIIPTFNQARYLPACVDHCLFQTYPDLEIIIVDGGSTDGTKDYLAGLEKEVAERRVEPVVEMDERGEIIRREQRVYPKGRRLEILVFGEDIGPTRTINEGLSRAKGDYCTYIVGDDIPHPHMIEELVSALERTGADFAYSDMNIVDDTGRIVRQMRLPDYSFDVCFARWYHLGVSRLYRTAWHEKVGLMDERYQGANDYDHYLRFAMAGAKFFHLPKVLYSVRHHGDNRKTGQHTEERYANLIQESKHCAWRARSWIEGQRHVSGRRRDSMG
ncbi:MAG: glycosyltransferase [Deltaproteobacteria bacterium]|nr:glycosyltransferase [Deltaproteobacteria bacterium]